MKIHTLGKSAAIGLASLIITIGAPLAKAAKLRIDGGFVTLGTDKVIRLAQESGRYVDLGKNYYRTATIGCAAIRNITAKGKSGQLSFEYWALPYLGSGTGKPLMSVLLPSIKGGKRLNNLNTEAPAGYYNAYGYIQLRLYEYSGGTWVLRVSKNVGDRQLL